MLSLKKISLFSSVAAVLLALSGCEMDGRNASDNPSTAPQLVSSGGPGDGGGVEPLPEAGAPLLIDSEDMGDVETAKAVMDGSGNVTTVWTQSDGARINLWSSRYTVGSGWSNAQKLEGGGSTLDVKEFQLVVDASGNVTVVWTQISSDAYTSGPTTVNVNRTDLWAKRYYVSGGWGSEEKIESSDLSAILTENIEDIGEFQLVVDSAGEVSVLWTQHNGSRYDLYARRSVAGVWDAAPTLVDSENLGDVSSPQLLVDGSGNLFALWTQSDGTRLNLWGARYAAAAWSTAAKIDSEDLGDVEAPEAVVDGNGDATIVWRQSNGSYWNLWTSRYAGGVWSAAALAETRDGDVSTPQLLLYGTAKVMLLWVQSDGVVNNVWSKHYDAGWVDDGNITNDTGDAGSVVMVKDSAGVVTAAWVQHDSDPLVLQDNLWANRFSAGSWGSAGLIETQGSGDVRSPMLLVDSSNRVSAIWLQKESGRFDLWSNHYASGSWGTAGLVERIDDGSAVDPHAAMDSSGNITLVWRQPYDSGNHLVVNYYSVGATSGWGASVGKIESPNYDNGYNPLLLVDSTGLVTVVWLQPVTTGQTVRIDLWGNRF